MSCLIPGEHYEAFKARADTHRAIRQNIVLTRHEDGTYTALGFPDEIIISRDLLERAGEPYLERPHARAFTVTVSNGHATYRLTRKGSSPRTYVARRTS